MRTEKLSEKVCMLSSLRTDMENCEGKGTWNQDMGLCSYDSTYCSKKGLKKKMQSNGVNDCFGLPGQDMMEMVFGKTVTRGGIKVANEYAKLYVKGAETLFKYGIDPKTKLDLLEKAGKLGLKHGADVGRAALRGGAEAIDKLFKLSPLGDRAVAMAAEKGIDAIRDGYNTLIEFGPEDAKVAINKGVKAAVAANNFARSAAQTAAKETGKGLVKGANEAAKGAENAARKAGEGVKDAINSTKAGRAIYNGGKDAINGIGKGFNEVGNFFKNAKF
jgi:hypothetical protein